MEYTWICRSLQLSGNQSYECYGKVRLSQFTELLCKQSERQFPVSIGSELRHLRHSQHPLVRFFFVPPVLSLRFTPLTNVGTASYRFKQLRADAEMVYELLTQRPTIMDNPG